MKPTLRMLITIATLLCGSFLIAPVIAQDLTTILAQFLTDLRSGSLGVGYPITNLTVTGNVAAANVLASNTFSTSGRSFLRTGANGLWTLAQNSAASGVEVNMGTAVPTATTCGTGAVTAKSTNTAGEVTATGATTCTLTFGAPAWTNTPFCTVEEETTLASYRVSAISVTAFTVTGLTSNDKFMYVCFGGL